jgi:hypothetical protein
LASARAGAEMLAENTMAVAAAATMTDMRI